MTMNKTGIKKEMSNSQTLKPTQINNPLHGVKLEMIINELHGKYGWGGVASRIKVNCF